MNPTWPEVNAAVLAVLGDFLRGGSNRASSRNGRAARGVDHAPPVYVDRLLSLRAAERITGAVGPAREVRVGVGTVVTPLARDWLRRAGVTIRVVSGRDLVASRAQTAGEWGFALESRVGWVDALRRSLLEGDAWAEVGADVARWVADGDGRGALVVADEASVATWRANRTEGIRAASVTDRDAVARAVRHLGANVLVVEPVGQSIPSLKHLADQFRRGGAPTEPEGWGDDS